MADRLEAVKRRNWKIVFYEEQRDWSCPPIRLGEPKAFDLIPDPKEEYPATGLRSTWSAGPVMKIVSDFEQSVKKYPPIAPGAPDPNSPPNGYSALNRTFTDLFHYHLATSACGAERTL